MNEKGEGAAGEGGRGLKEERYGGWGGRLRLM